MTEVKCIHGASTERSCPRPGTVPYWEDDPSGVKLCEVHAALEPVRDEINDLSLALEKLEELQEYGREWGNQPVLGLVERARAEFTERQEFLERHAQAVSLAGR